MTAMMNTVIATAVPACWLGVQQSQDEQFGSPADAVGLGCTMVAVATGTLLESNIVVTVVAKTNAGGGVMPDMLVEPI